MHAKLQTYRQQTIPFTSEGQTCQQIREILDDVFSNSPGLEMTDSDVRRNLFAHLAECNHCCRSFDARLKFGVARRVPII